MMIIATETRERASRHGDIVTEELKNLIAESYSLDELDQFIRMALGQELWEEINWNGSIDIVVYRVLNKVYGDGKSYEFLQALKSDKPYKADLRDIADRFLDELSEGPPDQENAAQVGPGFDMMADIANKNAQVRAIINAAKPQLTALKSNAQILAKYKLLHDYLQDLQIGLFPSITNSIGQLPDKNAEDTLSELIDDLELFCRECRGTTEELPKEGNYCADEDEWVSKLERAWEKFKAGRRKGPDSRNFRAAKNDIECIIRQEPGRINAKLTSRAHALSLEKLKEVITKVVNEIGTTADGASELKRAGESLETLTSDLKAQVECHRKWQEIEGILWLAEGSLISKQPNWADAFSEYWADIKDRFAELESDAKGEAWVNNVKKYMIETDTALVNDLQAIGEAFHNFCRQARKQFSNVNKELNVVCSALSRNIERWMETLLPAENH
jgi:hypothetical protein